MALNYRHGHDVEDPAGVGVFWIGQLLIAGKAVVRALYFAVYLAPVRTFQIDTVITMGLNGAVNPGIGRLLLG